MDQTSTLRMARERLDTILLSLDAANRLGCMDEKIKQALKYQIRQIIWDNIINPYMPSEWRVSDRAIYLEYSPTRAQLIAIGKEAARLYREQYGSNPPHLEQVLDGETRLINVYSGKALDLLDTCIHKLLRESPSKNGEEKITQISEDLASVQTDTKIEKTEVLDTPEVEEESEEITDKEKGFWLRPNTFIRYDKITSVEITRYADTFFDQLKDMGYGSKKISRILPSDDGDHYTFRGDGKSLDDILGLSWDSMKIYGKGISDKMNFDRTIMQELEKRIKENRVTLYLFLYT